MFWKRNTRQEHSCKNRERCVKTLNGKVDSLVRVQNANDEINAIYETLIMFYSYHFFRDKMFKCRMKGLSIIEDYQQWNMESLSGCAASDRKKKHHPRFTSVSLFIRFGLLGTFFLLTTLIVTWPSCLDSLQCYLILIIF